MLQTFNLDKSGIPAFPANFRILKTAVLNRADLRANSNKFYVLEVHEAQGQYRLFTNYGRVGTPGVREGRYTDDLQDALAEFERLYREKTGKSKGYAPVDVKQALVGSATARDHVSRSAPHLLPNPFTAVTPATSLHPELARFVERIYDSTKSELVRRIETPLGSLSSAQIERGQDKLREIRFAIARQRKERLVGLTGEYFSLVPHRLGLRIDINDVVIDTVRRADDEEELLQLMRDVFHVQDDLEADVERKYRALGAQICALDKTSAEYQRVEQKILGAHSWRHNFNAARQAGFRADAARRARPVCQRRAGGRECAGTVSRDAQLQSGRGVVARPADCAAQRALQRRDVRQGHLFRGSKQ